MTVIKRDYFVRSICTIGWYAGSTPNAIYIAAINETWVSYQAGDNRETRVIAYRHHRTDLPPEKRWSEEYTISTSGIADDDHGVPVLALHATSGHVYCIFGNHNGPQNVARTTTAGNPSAWTELSDIPGSITYPHPTIIGNTLYVFSRESMRYLALRPGPITGNVPDFGANVRLLDVHDGVSDAGRVYQGNHIVIGGEIHLVFSRSDSGDTERLHVYYLRYDPTTGSVKNWDASTVVASGSLPVDLTTLNSAFRLFEHTGGNQGPNPKWCVDSLGGRHIMFGDGVDPEYELKHLYLAPDDDEWVLTEDIGTAIDEDRFAIGCYPLASGEIAVAWPQDESDAFSSGGTILRRVRSAAGVWSSEETLLAAGYRGLTMPNMVEGPAHADARLVFCEVTRPENAENGTLRGYCHGDSGLLKRRY